MRYHNILHIDDDEDDQEIFFTALEQVSKEISCISLNDASDALQKLSTNEIIPDLICMDLNMPGMNGLQFLGEIQKNAILQHIPVIVFSTSSNFLTIELTKQLGAFDFITKPGNYNELVNILTRILSLQHKKVNL